MSLVSAILNEDAANQFFTNAGRMPMPGEIAEVNQRYSSMSYDDFARWAAQFYVAPQQDFYSPDALRYYSPMPLNAPTLPTGTTPPLMMPPTTSPTGVIGAIGTIGSVIGAIGSLIGATKGQPPGTPLAPPGTAPKGPPPKATFFGGECPPGRKLRRVAFGRDICVKAPRMNPFNPRALARADRRVTAFARRSKAILQDLGYHVSPRKKSITTKRRRR